MATIQHMLNDIQLLTAKSVMPEDLCEDREYGLIHVARYLVNQLVGKALSLVELTPSPKIPLP